MKGGETEVFTGKTLSSLLEDIYNISRDKRKDIKAVIGEMSKLIVNPADVANIAPIIKDYYDVSVKNDDQLFKIATIVQRVISAEAYQSGEGGGEILSESEKDQLIRNAGKELVEATKELEQELTKLSDAAKPKV